MAAIVYLFFSEFRYTQSSVKFKISNAKLLECPVPREYPVPYEKL